MSPRVPPPAALLAVLLIAVAGCVGGPTAGDATTEPPTTSPAPAQPSFQSSPIDCSGVEWVSFWAINEYDRQQFWEPDTARVGYTIAGGETVFFVAYADGEVAGVTRTYYDSGSRITADGAKVDLDEPLSGTRTIRVVAHEDSNGDGEFDAETDRPCKNDGEVVGTGVERLNFTALEGTPTSEDGA